MDTLKQRDACSAKEDLSSLDIANLNIFYQLVIAVQQYNIDKIKSILKKVSNIRQCITIQDMNHNGNTLLHLALKNINGNSKMQRVADVIKHLIRIGAPLDIKNEANETPVDLLHKRLKDPKNIKWEDIKNIFESEKTSNFIIDEDVHNASTKVSVTAEIPSGWYNSTNGAKGGLHGLTYQLKIIMFFVQQMPDEYDFRLATEMDEADKFDDVVLKYKKDAKWKYICVQAKHKHQDDKNQIKISDLFNIDGNMQKSEGSYFLRTYYDSFRYKIAKNHFFNDGVINELLLCTNLDFSEDAKAYFEEIQDRDDFLLKHPTVKYKLGNIKIEELKILLQIDKDDSKEDKYLLDFIEKFRFMVNFGDNVIYEILHGILEDSLNIKNIDICSTFIQDRLLKWFENYKCNKDGFRHSKYFQLKDKSILLVSLKHIIQSLFVAGYSSFFVNELKSHKIVFNNPLPDLKRDLLNKATGLFVVVTSSSLLSTMKLCQIIDKLNLKQDEVIFLSSSKIRNHETFVNIFCYDPIYKFLVIKCDRGEKIDKIIDDVIKTTQKRNIAIFGQENDVRSLSSKNYKDTGSSLEKLEKRQPVELMKQQEIIGNDILKVTEEKNIIVIGQREDVEHLSEKRFYDTGSSFKSLDETSQIQFLQRKVIFQCREVRLDHLIDVNSAQDIIDDLVFEELLMDKINIGCDLKKKCLRRILH